MSKYVAESITMNVMITKLFCTQLTKAFVAETSCNHCYWFCYVFAHDQFAQYQQSSNEPLQYHICSSQPERTQLCNCAIAHCSLTAAHNNYKLAFTFLLALHIASLRLHVSCQSAILLYVILLAWPGLLCHFTRVAWTPSTAPLRALPLLYCGTHKSAPYWNRSLGNSK